MGYPIIRKRESQRRQETQCFAILSDALRPLRGFRKPVYIAGANPEAIQAALLVVDNTHEWRQYL